MKKNSEKNDSYLFEVFSEDGRPLMFTNDKRAVYSKETLISMIKGGMKLKENGKLLTLYSLKR